MITRASRPSSTIDDHRASRPSTVDHRRPSTIDQSCLNATTRLSYALRASLRSAAILVSGPTMHQSRFSLHRIRLSMQSPGVDARTARFGSSHPLCRRDSICDVPRNKNKKRWCQSQSQGQPDRSESQRQTLKKQYQRTRNRKNTKETTNIYNPRLS